MPAEPGKLLREVRKRNQVKQSVLADQMGTTQSVISRYERGERSPSVAYLEKALATMGEELSIEARPKTPPRATKKGNILYDPLDPL